VKLVRIAIWLATGGFVLLLFYPLVMQMLDRLGSASLPTAP
jgi:hypothetical protein